MPYIHQTNRDALANDLASLAEKLTGVGDLNYSITRLVQNFLARRRKPIEYTDCNEMIGVLESVKLEFYRRVLVPYEDNKCMTNRDVFDV